MPSYRVLEASIERPENCGSQNSKIDEDCFDKFCWLVRPRRCDQMSVAASSVLRSWLTNVSLKELAKNAEDSSEFRGLDFSLFQSWRALRTRVARVNHSGISSSVVRVGSLKLENL